MLHLEIARLRHLFLIHHRPAESYRPQSTHSPLSAGAYLASPLNMNPDPSLIETKILNLIRTELLETTADFNVDSDLFDAGLDSMAIMQLTLLMERDFGASIPEKLIVKSTFATVRNLANVLMQLGLTRD